MKKILILVGSNHSQSINKQLAEYAGHKLEGNQVDIVDLQNLDAPMYSIDIEKNQGHPEAIKSLYAQMQKYDAYIIASPEHNGLMPAILKNTIDWLSRVGGKFLGNKPVALLSTSPGATGGANNLKVMSHLLPWWGGQVVDTFSLGSFNEKFDTELKVITDSNEDEKLDTLMKSLIAA